MPSYAHKKLVERIAELDQEPEDEAAFAEWIKAGAHLTFLRENAREDEIVIYGSGQHFFAHSLIVANDRLSPVDEEDLLGWNSTPFTSIASQVWGGSRDVWIERGDRHRGANALTNAMDLVFARTFEGWADDEERTYFEVHQEYTHLSGIHWRPEHRAYCRFDGHGDLEYVVSVTSKYRAENDVTLVSFSWDALEEYLTLSRSTLVRMFDFTLLRRGSFGGWPKGPEDRDRDPADLFWRQKVAGAQAAYTRGVQIIRPRRSPERVFGTVKGDGEEEPKYAEFIAHDWRNRRVAKISTDPAATTNYFEAKENTLPFELSPAFFRPEVLLKYKTDRDKYSVGERDVGCRAGWTLRAYDVNEAGQVHAYICYLRNLPHAEQLHWLSFNEEPKAGISKRAVVNDFEGEFVDFSPPLRQLIATARKWDEKRTFYWTLRDRSLLDQISTPLTASREEWSEAFMDLSKLVVEGFEVAYLRGKLDAAGVAYGPSDQSIALLEKLRAAAEKSASVAPFEGLRTVQRIRSKVKGHAGSSEAKQIAQSALAKHETFGGHFTHVCGLVAAEMETIQQLMR